MTAPTPARPDPDAERAPAAAPDRAEQVLARFGWARLWAAARAPYLARALFALQPVLVEAHLDEDTGEPVADPALRAFPTDTRWRVHLDPGTALATPVAEIGWWMLHHIGHLVRHHAERAPAPPEGPSAPAAGQAARPRGAAPAAGGREPARPWNRAADAEVNDDLESMGLTTPAGVVSPRGLGLPPGRLAEEYLSLIEVLDAAHRRGGRPLADPIDCGGAVDGIDDAPPGAARRGAPRRHGAPSSGPSCDAGCGGRRAGWTSPTPARRAGRPATGSSCPRWSARTPTSRSSSTPPAPSPRPFSPAS